MTHRTVLAESAAQNDVSIQADILWTSQASLALVPITIDLYLFSRMGALIEPATTFHYQKERRTVSMLFILGHIVLGSLEFVKDIECQPGIDRVR